MAGPSDKAMACALEGSEGALAEELRDALEVAHGVHPIGAALGLDRSVCLRDVLEAPITDEEIKAAALALFQSDWGAAAFPDPPSHTRKHYIDLARTALMNARAARVEHESNAAQSHDYDMPDHPALRGECARCEGHGSVPLEGEPRMAVQCPDCEGSGEADRG